MISTMVESLIPMGLSMVADGSLQRALPFTQMKMVKFYLPNSQLMRMQASKSFCH